jgi:hypothetical protein
MTNIGVTGHRVLYNLSLVSIQVDNALAKIQERFPGPFFVYSSLAEGADRLVVQRAFEVVNAGLLVPLPFEPEDYSTDFSEESRLVFFDFLKCAEKVIGLPASSTRIAAYEAAGRYILDHVNVLIALWDGKPARGQGGTGQMVLEARQRGLPIAWVHIINEQPGLSASSDSANRREGVTYEGFLRGKLYH